MIKSAAASQIKTLRHIPRDLNIVIEPDGKIIYANLPLEFHADGLFDLLVSTISLTPGEKLGILSNLQNINSSELEKIITVLEKERTKLAEIDSHQPGYLENIKRENLERIQRVCTKYAISLTINDY